MTPSDAIAALVEESRLQVAGSIVGATRPTTEIAEVTGLTEREVLEAVGELRRAGLIDVVDSGYTIPTTRVRQLAEDWSATDVPMDPWVGFGMNESERTLLARFFHGRTLTEIPANRAKRLVVLERVALEFDLGRRYTEDEVNDELRSFHPDHAALRRHLVDEGLLDRDRGEYWRSGGRFDA